MRKFYSGFLALCVSGLLSCNETPNLAKFKNGNFKSIVPGMGVNMISRNGDTQTEQINTKPEVTFKVKWLDEKTYTLTPTEDYRKKYKLPADAKMTVKITKTTDTSYFCTGKTSFSDLQINSEIIKLN